MDAVRFLLYNGAVFDPEVLRMEVRRLTKFAFAAASSSAAASSEKADFKVVTDADETCLAR